MAISIPVIGIAVASLGIEGLMKWICISLFVVTLVLWFVLFFA